MKTMTKTNTMVFVVAAIFALTLIALPSASAFGAITGVEVNGVDALNQGLDFGDFTGNKIPVLVTFKSNFNTSEVSRIEDVRITAWISGDRADAVETDRFDVLDGNVYSRLLYVTLPSDLNEDLSQKRVLEIVVENEKDGTADSASIDLTVQRDAYKIDILSVSMQNEVKAGDSVVMDVVLKNRGSHLADDMFLDVTIPELGLNTRTYFSDLSPTDEANPDRNDAIERRTYLRLPKDTPAGLYTVRLEAFNDDSYTVVEKKLLVSSAKEDVILVTPVTSRTVNSGESAPYELTIVNRGTTVSVYSIELDSTSPRLDLSISDPVIVIPAGSSRTVDIGAVSMTEGSYTFKALVTSDEGASLAEETFHAEVDKEAAKANVSGTSANNATVLLTVILVIVFLVLLIVLIVLLTRKPAKSEEFGESYY